MQKIIIAFLLAAAMIAVVHGAMKDCYNTMSKDQVMNEWKKKMEGGELDPQVFCVMGCIAKECAQTPNNKSCKMASQRKQPSEQCMKDALAKEDNCEAGRFLASDECAKA